MFHSYRLDASRSDTFQWNFWEATNRYDPPIDKTKDTVPEQTSWAANIDRGEGSCREPRREMMVDDDLIFLDYVKKLSNATKNWREKFIWGTIGTKLVP